jgi:RNA polymerase sigma-70 factor (ECF subfamily)
MESDERLYERLRAGELDAFDALYARYERRLFAFVRGWLDDSSEAEDVLSEAFLSLLRSRPPDFSRGTFKSWIYQIARNACLNRLRARRRGERAFARVRLEPATAQKGPMEAVLDAEAKLLLSRAVSRLPPLLNEIYQLRASGLSYEEMATVLAIPLGTVKSRMHDLMLHLKKEMLPWTAS